MDYSKISFLNDFYSRLIAAGYSDIEIEDRTDGTCKWVKGRLERLDEGEFVIRYCSPVVNGFASCHSIILTEAEIVHIPHDVVLDLKELEKYFGRSFV